MDGIKEKVLELISHYEAQLYDQGIYIEVSKKYFETTVGEQFSGSHYHLDRIDKKLERKYSNKRNKYHFITLTVRPVEKQIIHRENCKEYSFLLSKRERPHIGVPPKETEVDEFRLLSKIEKRVLKIIKKAERSNPKAVCSNTLFDALRYTSAKYGYKKHFFGKDRITWEIVLLSVFGILALILIFVAYLIYN